MPYHEYSKALIFKFLLKVSVKLCKKKLKGSAYIQEIISDRAPACCTLKKIHDI